jgi:hypothetical protein
MGDGCMRLLITGSRGSSTPEKLDALAKSYDSSDPTTTRIPSNFST